MPSLKQFHILFVFVSMILCGFLAYWAFNHDLMQYCILFILSTLLLMFYDIKLMIYGIKFLY